MPTGFEIEVVNFDFELPLFQQRQICPAVQKYTILKE